MQDLKEKKETKSDLVSEIFELTKGITKREYIEYYTGRHGITSEGIKLKCDRFGNCTYRRDELIQIRDWLKDNLKSS